MIIPHPAELTLGHIHCMERTELIEQLLVFNDYYMFHFRRDSLVEMPSQRLRELVYVARRQYHMHGY